jgi:hypothetical protein
MPWSGTNNIPTLDTYCKSIHYFFKLVKSYDQQFQLPTWDIANKKCDTITDPDHLPKNIENLVLTYTMYI